MENFIVPAVILVIIGAGLWINLPGKSITDKLQSLKKGQFSFLGGKGQKPIEPPEEPSAEDPAGTGAAAAPAPEVPTQPASPLYEERCYAACIRTKENDVPIYCFIPVRGGLGQKNGRADVDLSSCRFVSDCRSRYMTDENGQKRQVGLFLNKSFPVVLHLVDQKDSPIPKLRISAKKETVSFSVTCRTQGCEDDSAFNVDSCLLDPECSYSVAIEDHSDVKAKGYSFVIDFCNGARGCDIDIVSAFMQLIETEEGDDRL